MLGEARLGGGVAVGVLQALDVAAEHRAHAEALHEAKEVHLHAGLVAVDIGADQAGRRGLRLQERSHGAVELGVHQHDVLAVLDRGEHQRGGLLDGAGHLEEDVDMGAGRDQHRIGGHRRMAGLDGARQRRGLVADHRVVLTGGGIGLHRLLRRAVGDGDHLHLAPEGGVDLQHHTRGHEARPDHADPDRRLALGGAFRQRGIDDDHGLLSFSRSCPCIGRSRSRRMRLGPNRPLNTGVKA